MEIRDTAISKSKHKGSIDLSPMKHAPPIASAIMVIQKADRSRRRNRIRAVATGLLSLSIVVIMAVVALHIFTGSGDDDVTPQSAVLSQTSTPLTVDKSLNKAEPLERERESRPSALLFSPPPAPAATAPKILHREKVRRSRRAQPAVKPKVAPKSEPKTKVAPKPEPKSEAAKPKVEPTIAELIRRAAPNLVRKPTPKKSASLPKVLTRRQIVGAMNKVAAKVRKCFDRFKVPGLVDLHLKILPKGKAKLELRGIFSGTPTGACVLRAAEPARFPKFSGPPMRISYPFMLRLR